jgi:hypothetical protein
VAHVGRSESNSPARNKADHQAGGEFLHFAMLLPYSKVTYLPKIRRKRKIGHIPIAVTLDGID